MKKIYLVPNFVTTLGMLSGFYSVICSVRYEFIPAAWAIVIAAVFDMLDGRIARLAKATSSFGVEYDSLADVISFGIAPAILLYTWGLEPYGRAGWLIAFLFLACGALRLARFNVMTEVLSKNFFQGLPIPIAANAVSTFVIFNDMTNWPGWSGHASTQTFALCMSLVLSALMISTLPFPSFKELNWKSRATFGLLLVAMVGTVLLIAKPEITFFLLISAYILASLVWYVYRKILKKISKGNAQSLGLSNDGVGKNTFALKDDHKSERRLEQSSKAAPYESQ
jgi:CDP-diacylglycerol--serine O-phosphatidyltransferase